MRLSPILLSLALLCASSQALAGESRDRTGWHGNCPDAAPQATTGRRPAVDDPRHAGAPRPEGQGRASVRMVVAAASAAAAPRWHSFLPGMIR
jgi:hypothetical protein